MRYLYLALALAFAAPAFAQDAPVDGSVPEAVEALADEADGDADADADVESADADADAPSEVEDAAPAPTPEQIDATTESVSLLIDALQNKNWALAIGILLSLLVAFANKFGLKDKVGGKAVPWVTAGVAVFGAIGAALLAGVSIVEAASQGLVAGVAAIGGWEMALKHILAPKSDPEPAAE